MDTQLGVNTFAEGQRLALIQADLITQRVDAIVNAANAKLAHGGGIAALIARKGGAVIERESRAWVREHGPITHEEPAYTAAGALPCRYVIHAVGPVWGSGGEDAKLAAAVIGSLRLAERLALESLALPAISTGIFGFPKKRAAGVIFRAVHDYFESQPGSSLKDVRVVVYDQPTADVFQAVWEELHPG